MWKLPVLIQTITYQMPYKQQFSYVLQFKHVQTDEETLTEATVTKVCKKSLNIL